MVRCWVAGLFGLVRGRLTILCGVLRGSFVSPFHAKAFECHGVFVLFYFSSECGGALSERSCALGYPGFEAQL